MQIAFYNFDLSLVPSSLRDRAKKYLDTDDIEGALSTMSSHVRLDFVYMNQFPLLNRGALEKAFINAYMSHNVRMRPIDPDVIEEIFENCDFEYMREELSPPPVKKKRYKLYRGTLNAKEELTISPGYSWTSSYKVAESFARPREGVENADPAVLVCYAGHRNIAFYTNDREEEEYFLHWLPPNRVKIHTGKN